MNFLKRGALATLLTTSIIFSPEVQALETDQYMTWNVELEDSAEPFNRKLNEEFIPKFLDEVNKENKIETREELTMGLYKHLFLGLRKSAMRQWLNTSPEIDRFPDDTVSTKEFKKESIYKSKAPFPWFFLPMSRTINIDGVYIGIDKISHMLGFGRRYFREYLGAMEKGSTKKEATEKVIDFGIHGEKGFVGSFVDGIFSYADLEANYQGFLLSVDLSSSDEYFKLEEGKWKQVKDIDIRGYINPDFDESYNTSHYVRTRKRKVLPLVKGYCGEQDNKIVQERFAEYENHEHSFSYGYVQECMGEKLKLKEEQSLECLCSE